VRDTIEDFSECLVPADLLKLIPPDQLVSQGHRVDRLSLVVEIADRLVYDLMGVPVEIGHVQDRDDLIVRSTRTGTSPYRAGSTPPIDANQLSPGRIPRFLSDVILRKSNVPRKKILGSAGVVGVGTAVNEAPGFAPSPL
jgi:hypothetical protein